MAKPVTYATLRSSVMLTSPLGVIAHDAGAANQIFHWILKGDVRELGVTEYVFALQGPALNAAQEVLPGFENKSVSEVIHLCTDILCGTGWGDYEFQAMAEAVEAGRNIMAVFDHWVNYSPRIRRNGKTLPLSAIVVSDDHALRLAKTTFPHIAVQQWPGRYLEYQVSKIAAIEDKTKALFLMEPVRTRWPDTNEPGEFLAFSFFMNTLHDIAPDVTTVIVRPHPSDPPHKYDACVAVEGRVNVVVDSHSCLSDLISACCLVCGLQSYAMVVALKAGRRVVSALPVQAPPAVLPFREIEYLRDNDR